MRTAIQSLPKEERCYDHAPVPLGQLNEVASVLPKEVHTVVLDPNTIPNASVSFEMRPVDDGISKRLGPFRLMKGETAEMVVTPDLEMSHVEVHPPTP